MGSSTLSILDRTGAARGDDGELDDHRDREDDHADDEGAADGERAEGLHDLPA